ncbi:LuxR family transcriptional regulator [Sphaerisporangium rufum]|uniref:LuxR family transcriptional regulator n=1 Tax=Sphaerisporangium rufum TaxID=1381558 RepID=A0A919V2C4_9ACTN|nr:LuxR family transcriptional regulator [Sphaerisporangium rufum]GII78793.1 LuxR family transcriptional regulator [Sphaerisporangium rufum]
MSLMERQEALASLEGLLASAIMGKGRVALVSGAVATGKSELLHSFAEQAAERGALPVTATGSAAERDLPLGVLGQLIQDAPLTPADRERAMALLREGARTVLPPGGGPAGLNQVDAQVVHALCTVLLELSERYPLLLIVDDVHHADRASLLCLSYLARRVRFAAIMAVFGHSSHGRYAEASFPTELLRQPHCRRVQLAPLSQAGVMSLVAEQLGTGDAERFAGEWYDYTGGNPLLAAGLMEDHQAAVRAAGGQPPAELVPGDAYGQAVLSCLHRADPRLLRVAFGLGVLGRPEALDRLLDVSLEYVTRELQSLAAAGVLSGGRFRHEAARAAVLAELDPAERAGLHRRAAELAYAGGGSTTAIADHLLQAGQVREPWAVEVLEDAARHALRDGRVHQAVEYLRLACLTCADEQRRTRITTALMRAEWRLNPSTPTGHFPELTDALQRGHLRGGDAVVLAKALLWHGRFDDAQDVLRRVGESEEKLDAETVTELVVTRPWVRVTHTPFLSHVPQVTGEQSRAAILTVSAYRRLESSVTLASVLTRGPRKDLVAVVERILRSSRLDEMSMDTVESALLALTYGGRPDKAAPWCDLFIDEASSRHAPSRRARLSAIRAEIALRQGDMLGAEFHGRLALDAISLSGWGVAAGGPLSSLVIAATAMGLHDAVNELLDLPVPEAMFQTRWGLHYLHARGRYSMATEHAQLALRDFQRCGELMGRWDIDVPWLIPWRAEAAEACLRLGRPDQARRLAEEQIRRCGGSAPRVHGIAMRLLAATGEARHRPMLLRQAGDLLQSSGDRYELARVLADLTEAFHALGEYRRAGMIGGRARAVAQECHAEPLARALARGADTAAAGPAPGAAPEAGDATAVLSDAERRVAVLAAAGYTNREIADKLYVTVSTVEQHLTRTYRKLDITSRAELPSTLELGTSMAV